VIIKHKAWSGWSDEYVCESYFIREQALQMYNVRIPSSDQLFRAIIIPLRQIYGEIRITE
jgi:CRISPR/Cas system CSM-associated protein Csm4 (group 5 of RAMP superfamily)